MDLRALLSRGDRRSLHGVEQVLALARNDSEVVADLLDLTQDPDPLIVMRACDALEKLARENPAPVAEHKSIFADLLTHPNWEVRLQCVRAVGLFTWTPDERALIVEGLRMRIDDDNKMVQCWALDSFALLVENLPDYQAELEGRLREFLESPFSSLRARARAICKRLS